MYVLWIKWFFILQEAEYMLATQNCIWKNFEKVRHLKNLTTLQGIVVKQNFKHSGNFAI